jgi:hypothetical protein
MLIEPMFYAIFYDVDHPKDVANAMLKRIDKNKYINISDGLIQKNVFLNKDRYTILSAATFNIVNSIDNTFFVVCDVKKQLPKNGES